jgi:hypothetical protein
MSNNNIQFRRGSKQDYDAIKASGITDSHDIYLVGGEEHKNAITTTGADGQTTTSYETKPLSIFVGGESVQTVLSKPIIVTKTVGGVSSSKGTLQPGESIEDILRQILSECINPTSFTKPTASVYFNGNTNTTSVPKGLYFVGSELTIEKMNLQEKAGSYQKTNIPGQVDPEYDRSNYIIEASSAGGFQNYAMTTASGTSAAAATIASTGGIKVSNGNNTILVTGSYHYEVPTNKPKNNFGEYVDRNANNSWLQSATTSDRGTVTATGVFPIFSNCPYIANDGTDNCNPDAEEQDITIYKLVDGNNRPVIDTYNTRGSRRLRIESINGVNMKISVPEGITIAKMNAYDGDNGASTKYNASGDGDKYVGNVYDINDNLTAYAPSETTSYIIAGTTVNYNTYEFKNVGGKNTYKITFGGSK